MPTITVARRFAAPADDVWRYVRWHGVAQLAHYAEAYFEKITFETVEEVVGAIKTIYPFDGDPIIERLEELNVAERTYRYRLLDNGGLPITDYTGYVRVTPAGPHACFLKIECNFTPVDVSAEQWEATWRDMENGMMDEIELKLHPVAAAAE